MTPQSSPAPVNVKPTDTERRRATYKLTYPQDDFTFLRSTDPKTLPKADPQDQKSTIEAKRLTFNLERKNLENIVFRECNFHDKKGQGQSEIKRLTFRDCIFKNSIMGTCDYSKVRFVRCRFEKCDFSDAEFLQCIFDDCEFFDCTGERVLFDRTEIDPMRFLKGYVFPKDNYSGASETQRQLHEGEWQESKYRIAGQLFRSNNEAFDSGFADAALKELKSARLNQRLYKISKKQHSRTDRIASLFERLNLFLTEGGTSIRRLLLFAGIFVLFIPPWLDYVQVNLYSKEMQLRTTGILDWSRDYLFAIPSSGGLFLGFGYGAFESHSVCGAWSLFAITALGITWYALIIPVLIRKVYR